MAHGIRPARMHSPRFQGKDIVPLAGSRTRERLEEALGVLDVTLTAADLASLEASLPARRRGGQPPQRAGHGVAG